MKVIICDDQAIVRDGLEMLLKLEPDIQVIGIAQEGATAIDLVEKERPGPGLNGSEDADLEWG